MTDVTAQAHWDEIYRTRRKTSSGQPSKVLVRVTEGMTPGRALDLGASNGDDVIWLAQQGWQALGCDISPVACDRAAARAADLGLASTARFEARDLGQGLPTGAFDLVTALFFQSDIDLARDAILAAAAKVLAPGGHLLVVSHASAPPWAGEEMRAKAALFPTVAGELAAIGKDIDWIVHQAEVVERIGKDPDGNPAPLEDNVIWLQRPA